MCNLGLAYTGKNFTFGIGGNNLNQNATTPSSIINGITPYFNQSATASAGAGPQIVGPVSFVSNSIVQTAFTNGQIMETRLVVLVKLW